MKKSIFSILFLISIFMITELNAQVKVKARGNTTKVKVKSNNRKVVKSNNRSVKSNSNRVIKSNKSRDRVIRSNRNRVVVSKPIRPKKRVVRPNYIKRGFFWIEGYWKWSLFYGKYIWVEGRWERERPGYFWVPGYWEITPGGFYWVEGYWGY
ncbi:MAG: hypothetical protein CMP65_06235 [Flavobacteriales bacterium]|nr:hypothetical protein [Flavobacteriales bacterium]MBJ05474.1 hypothetical protein [Flavobacteriales bacterium]